MGGFITRKIFLILLTLTLLNLTGCGGDFDKREKIIIGIDAEFAPLAFKDERGELTGFDIELASEAMKRLGVNAEFKPIIWDNKEAEIISGNIDMIWNGLDITDERKEYMIFSKPYMDDRQIVLVTADSELDIHSEYDLEGKIVGTQAGSTSDDYIDDNAELKNSFKEYKTYERFNETLSALKSGEIEVIVCDELVARYEMTICPDKLKIINIKIGEIAETGIGFAKNNTELRDRVQIVFDEMVKDGTARKISLKWFNADLIKNKK